MSKLEMSLEPIELMVDLIFELECKSFLDTQLSKHKTEILNNKSAKLDLTEFLKLQVKDILETLSEEYILKITKKYFTKSGLQLLIFYYIYNKCHSYIKDSI